MFGVGKDIYLVGFGGISLLKAHRGNLITAKMRFN